jgi:hypothetical protein
VLLTDTLNANTAALEQSDYIKLYNSVSIDYADITTKIGENQKNKRKCLPKCVTN